MNTHSHKHSQCGSAVFVLQYPIPFCSCRNTSGSRPHVIFTQTSTTISLTISYAVRKICIRNFEKQDKLFLFATTNINCHSFAGYEGQNHTQSGSTGGGDGTSSLDCLSLIVESISPSLLQGQLRSSVRLQATSKHEEGGDSVDQTAPVVKMAQQ